MPLKRCNFMHRLAGWVDKQNNAKYDLQNAEKCVQHVDDMHLLRKHQDLYVCYDRL